MRSKTSYFNRTLFLHDLRRFWPLTAGYTLLWLLNLPLERLTEYANSTRLSDWNMLHDTLNITTIGGYISAFLTGILFAMAAFSYLTNTRATNGLHALPARREELYVTHYLSGLCAQLAPQFIAVLLTAVILGSHAAFDARVTGLMLLTLALPTVFFYSFGVFCVMFTGQFLATPVFYGVLNVLVVSVEVLVRTFAGDFLYGWAEPETAELMPLSPIVKLVETDIRAIGTANEYYDTGSVSGMRMAGQLAVRGMSWLWIYAAAGVVFAALALLVYKRRHSEETGSIVAIGWARPVFRYGVSFCAALAYGQLLYDLFFGQYFCNGSYSLPGMLACMAAAGLVGYFAAEMLLKKSFRVWKTGWKGALCVIGALVALGFALSLDLTGYEGYIPRVDDVESVSVDLNIYDGDTYCYVTTSDPAAIRLAAAAHRALVKDKRNQPSGRAAWADDENPAVVGGYFDVNYTLRDGRIVCRRYRPIMLDSATLNDPASPAATLTALYNDKNVALARGLGRYGYNADNDPRALDDLRFTGGSFERSKQEDGEYQGYERHELSPAEADRIFQAVVDDAEMGHLAGSLFEKGQLSDISLELYATYADTRDYDTPRTSTRPSVSKDGRAQIEFDLTLTPSMVETLGVLRGMGIEVEF